MQPLRLKNSVATLGAPKSIRYIFPVNALTLLELLLVIAIIGLLSTLVAPAVNTVMHGSRLTQAGDKVVAVLNQARQAALTTNHRVEVRFYQYGDGEVPGENVHTPVPGYPGI